METSSIGVKQKWPIHRQPPPYEEVTAQNEMFETGIKVIDLLMPYVQGERLVSSVVLVLVRQFLFKK